VSARAATAEGAERVKILVSARNDVHAFTCAPGEKILRAGLRSGIALPYECGTGTCGTCKARLVEGLVDDDWPEAPGQAKLRRERGELLMCQGVARADCSLEVAGVVTSMAAAGRPADREAVIRRRLMLTHDVAALSLTLSGSLDFEAGQFVLMSVPGITGARAYSMVNFERGAERLELVVKKKPGGRLSEWLFGAPVDGTPVELFGPLGGATFDPDMGKSLLCVAGGSGIAGMMSILECATRARHFERHPGDVFFGVRAGRDVFFLDELTAFQARWQGALRVTIALSDENVDPALPARYPGLGFATGFVHAVAGLGMKGRFDNVRAYAAGPPPMVDATLRMLLVEGKLRSDNIRYDKFS
jgi:toluene monooxygenase electron transfer component